MVWDAISAIAVSILALTAVGVGVASLPLLAATRRLMARLERLADAAQHGGAPVLLAARATIEDTHKIIATVRSEVEGLAGTSQDLRDRVGTAAAAVEQRARDLEAVLDILQEEVEDTVLDVAAALRTTRRGASFVRALRRALLKGRR